MIERLTVFQKTYDFLLWLKQVVRGFSKAHRYSLGTQIENEALNLLRCIIKANLRQNKKEAIEECIIHYETVKMLIRLASDWRGSGTISVKQYAFAAERLSEIGKLLGGWHNRFM